MRKDIEMLQKRGLGRGLDVLIPQNAPVAAPRIAFAHGRTIMNLPLDSIKPNPLQPRKRFDENKLAELANSIREHGIVQPVVVRRNENGYELVAGERRLRASKLAGLELIPAIIKEMSSQASLEVALIENLQRENLDVIDEALAYQQLSEQFGLTQEQIAVKVGKSRSVVANALRMLTLPAEIQESIKGGLLSSGHGRTLAGVISPDQQIILWRQMLEGGYSVRQAEAMIGQKKQKASEKRLAKATKPDVELTDLGEKLSRKFSTKVSVTGSQSKGSIVIHYFSREDLERLMEILG
jgi:ParB family chromosome partitioning protein